MKHLESMLPANDLCVLYDPLIDEGERVGLLTRLKKQADWKIEDMQPWSYPQEQFAATLSANDAVKRAFSMSMQSFNLPIPFAIDPETNQAKLGNPERKLLKIRTEQLLGKFEEATQRYLSIRHLEIEPTPIPELMLLNRMGAENAWYWTGLCKFESGDYESAVEQLSGYLKRFERNGQWRASARAVLADCHARLGHYKEAIAVLERSRSDDPYRTANAIRVKRWSALAQ